MELHSDAELCRITIVAPRTRMDLALPVDATLADVLPTLLRHAGEDPNDPAFLRGGWVLQRLGEPPLDTGARLSGLGVRDGDTLHLRHRDSALPELAFDDVADAMAAATASSRRPAWQTRHTRTAAVTLAAVFLVAAALGLVWSGPPWPLPGSTLLGLGVLASAGSVALARAFAAPRAGVVVAGTAVAFGFAGGSTLVAGDQPVGNVGAPGLLVGSAVALLFAVVAALGLVTGRDGFLAIVAAALVGVVAGAVRAAGVLDPPGVAAATVAVLLVLTPLLPAAAARVGRLPMPGLPTGADDLRRIADTLPGPAVMRQAMAADRTLTALLAATAAVATVCMFWVVRDGAWYGAALSSAVGLALYLRARHLTGLTQRIWLLACGTGALLLGLHALTRWTTGPLLVVLPLALAAAAVAALAWAVRMADRRLTPYWGRFGDLLEVLLLLSVIPLALGVAGTYTAVRNLLG